MLQHKKQEQLITSILKKFDTDVIKTISNVENLLISILSKEGFTETTVLNFQYLYNQALEQSGYFALINDFVDNKFDELYQSIRYGFEQGGLFTKYTETDLDKIIALKEMTLTNYDALAVSAGAEIQQALYKNVLSNYSESEMINSLKENLKSVGLSRYAKTYSNTAIRDFQESVIDMKAKDLKGVWLYVGVSDSKTRDYCKCILNKDNYFNDNQKNRLQRDPKRKYNCRHRFRKVTREFAKKEGFTKAISIKC